MLSSWSFLLGIAGMFFRYSPRMEMLYKAMTYARASNLQGEYLEFGVSRGQTFALAYHFAKTKGMRFFAFDSFKGLPDAEEYRLSANLFKKGDYACSADAFRRYVRSKGVDLRRVSVVEGWFDKTLTSGAKERLGLRQAAVVMVDCDLYQSAVSVLDFITDLLVQGSVLMFDDWFLFGADDNHGVHAATVEWLYRNPSITLVDYHKFGWHGNSFIVRKTDAR